MNILYKLRVFFSVLTCTLLLVSSPSAFSGEKRLRDKAMFSFSASAEYKADLKEFFAGKGNSLLNEFVDKKKIKGYQIFAGLISNSQGIFDASIIVELNKSTDLTAVSEIERSFSKYMLKKGVSFDLDVDILDQLSDVNGKQEIASINEKGKDNHLYIFAPHVIAIDKLKSYRKFVVEYIDPIMQAYIDEGVLESFDLYQNSYPAGSIWQAILVLEFVNPEQIEKREAVQADIRKRLISKDPTWKNWYGQKYILRSEIRTVLAKTVGAR